MAVHGNLPDSAEFGKHFKIDLKHGSRLRSTIALCIKCGIYAEFAKRSRARAVALGLAPAAG